MKCFDVICQIRYRWSRVGAPEVEESIKIWSATPAQSWKAMKVYYRSDFCWFLMRHSTQRGNITKVFFYYLKIQRVKLLNVYHQNIWLLCLTGMWQHGTMSLLESSYTGQETYCVLQLCFCITANRRHTWGHDLSTCCWENGSENWKETPWVVIRRTLSILNLRETIGGWTWIRHRVKSRHQRQRDKKSEAGLSRLSYKATRDGSQQALQALGQFLMTLIPNKYTIYLDISSCSQLVNSQLKKAQMTRHYCTQSTERRRRVSFPV